MTDQQFDRIIDLLSTPSWTQTIPVYGLAISIFIAAISVFLLFRQMKYDHRRSQSKIASDLCIKWTEFLAPETISVTKFIEKLSPNQAESIANLKVLEISTIYERDLIDMLEIRFPNIKDDLEKSKSGDTFKIEGQIVQHMRHIAVRYLNMLESILLSWSEAVADREAIFREFSYISSESKGRTAMIELRKKLGTEHFPSIKTFLEEMEKRKLLSENSVLKKPIAK